MGSSDSRLSDTLASQSLPSSSSSSSPSSSSLSGRVALVTGPTSGIGYETARVLAKHGCHVILAARDPKKTADCRQKLIAEIKKENGESFEPSFTDLLLNLGSLESVRTAANNFLSKDLPLHYLINNAGIMACPYSTTVDGFESQVGTNHLGHYYLTRLLLPKLRASATADHPCRIVNVSSGYHIKSNVSKIDDINEAFTVPKEKYSDFVSYGHSKLFNIYHARGVAEQEEKNNILAFSVHPGVVATDLARANTMASIFYTVASPFMKNCNQGASTTIHCTLAAKKEETGNYYANNKVARTNYNGRNNDFKQRLMEVSEKLINEWEEKHPITAASSSSSSSSSASA